MKDKFIEAYLSIITEAWDRYWYGDIINAVGIVINGGKDPWVKEETGKKIFQFLKDNGERTTGGKLVQMTDLRSKDDQIGVSTSKTQFYNGSEQFDAGYIYSYWKGRSKSGNTFDVDMFELIQSIDHRNGGYKYVIAPKVGQLAYAIWKR